MTSSPGKNRGVDNFKNRLSEDDVITIYKDTTHNNKYLAELYGVNPSTISHIKLGRTWSWLTKNIKE